MVGDPWGDQRQDLIEMFHCQSLIPVMITAESIFGSLDVPSISCSCVVATSIAVGASSTVEKGQEITVSCSHLHVIHMTMSNLNGQLSI